MLDPAVDEPSLRKRVFSRLRTPRVPLWAMLVLIAILAKFMAGVGNEWRRKEANRLFLVSLRHLHEATEYRIGAGKHRETAKQLQVAQREAMLRIHIAERAGDEIAQDYWARKSSWRLHHIENLPKLADWEEAMARYWEQVSKQPAAPLPSPPTKPVFRPPLDDL